MAVDVSREKCRTDRRKQDTKKYADCLHSVNLIKGSKDDPIYYTGDKDK
jgi:hypothetical protein